MFVTNKNYLKLKLKNKQKMKRLLVIFAAIILFASCATQKEVSNIKSNERFPETFEEAEVWFDNMHKKPIKISTIDTAKTKEIKTFLVKK